MYLDGLRKGGVLFGDDDPERKKGRHLRILIDEQREVTGVQEL